MEIHKTFIDLMGYGVSIDKLSIIPTRIDADEENCEVEFMVIDKNDVKKKIIRKGKHKDYVFSTSVSKTPFKIDLKTGVIRKIRISKE